MCFYVDYDWVASVVEENDDFVLQQDRKCCECSCQMTAGMKCYRIYMQEGDGYECLNCYGDIDECDCGDSDTIGNIETYYECHDCVKFLNVVKKVEIAAGCKQAESTPPYGEMYEYFIHMDLCELKKYFISARRSHPELVENGYLKRLWKLFCR